jgi:hypothetical protein
MFQAKNFMFKIALNIDPHNVFIKEYFSSDSTIDFSPGCHLALSQSLRLRGRNFFVREALRRR